MVRKGQSAESVAGRDSEAADGGASVDAAEVEKFARIAAEWWDERGKFRPLHKMNPARVALVRDTLAARFGRDIKAPSPLGDLAVLDIGCGGGLVDEPLARLGASVTGIDASAENVAVAREHAALTGLAIDYRAESVEALAESGAAFDAVLALEVAEHVTDPRAFVALCASLTRPGGIVIVSTINRTLKALALAKVAAEYILRWVPEGAHDFRRFLKPREMRAAFEAAGLMPEPPMGLVFDPLKDDWHRSLDTGMNYFMWAGKRV